MKNTREFIIRCSYYELYLNKIRDLGRDYESEYEKTVPYAKNKIKKTKNDYNAENLPIIEDSNG